LEAFTTRTVGARLKFVVEADSAVIDRLWTGETRRKETPFARRGIRVPVEPLDDDEFEVAMEVLRSLGVSFMDGAGKAEEYRQPWVLRSMTSAVLTSGELEQGAVATLPPLLSISLFSHARRQFLQDALVEQAATFARAVLDDYSRRDRSTEVSLRAMHNFMVRKRTMREHADTADIEAMEKSGLVGWTLDNSNRSIAIGRIPELIASELSRLIAAELRDRLGDAEKDADAADWFVNTAANIPLGDVIGAQALLDLAEQQMGISLGFLTGLLEGAPSVRPIKPGTRAVAWLPSIGELDVHMRADGVTEIKKRGWAKGIEFPADEGMQTYSNLSSWLILSHLAGVRLAALEPGSADVILGIADPAILALVGSSPIPLCRPAEDLERSGMPTHRGPEGSVLVCSENGIIEPVTLSLFRFLERERKGADDWLDEACREGSAPLLNRISQALSVLSGMNLQGEPAVWAREWNEGRVEPSLRRALAHQAKPRDDEDNTS
jgi:hypothetical protein